MSVLCEALFASDLQPSERPGAVEIRAAITRAVSTLTSHGCVARMAQEFGDNPRAAADRMQWVRDAVDHTSQYLDFRRDPPAGWI
ncbi:hypothetical protein GCM10022255_091670 [Dactylosporangium darangshiense]|uniref:Uncharacterized protein n=2 Tax=Dactylosporangium darangshiense TaxID=579108 RepID=A0ABP8DP77_9ACTN